MTHLQFTYEENSQNEDFFLPPTWEVVGKIFGSVGWGEKIREALMSRQEISNEYSDEEEEEGDLESLTEEDK